MKNQEWDLLFFYFSKIENRKIADQVLFFFENEKLDFRVFEHLNQILKCRKSETGGCKYWPFAATVGRVVVGSTVHPICIGDVLSATGNWPWKRVLRNRERDDTDVFFRKLARHLQATKTHHASARDRNRIQVRVTVSSACDIFKCVWQSGIIRVRHTHCCVDRCWSYVNNWGGVANGTYIDTLKQHGITPATWDTVNPCAAG